MPINVINRKDDEELFEKLIEDNLDELSQDDHRRGSNFYKMAIIRINETTFPDVSRELDGIWETNSYVWDADYGMDGDDIQHLYRVEEVEKTVITKEFVRVKE